MTTNNSGYYTTNSDHTHNFPEQKHHGFLPPITSFAKKTQVLMIDVLPAIPNNWKLVVRFSEKKTTK